MLTRPLHRVLSQPSFPLGGIDTEFDRVVDRLFNTGANLGMPSASRAGIPPLSVWEDEDSCTVEAELPGFQMADLDINLLGSQLTISGQRAQSEVSGGKFHRRERAFGRFSRTLELPSQIDAAKVSAALSHGVLTITLPKAEAAKPRKISITSK